MWGCCTDEPFSLVPPGWKKGEDELLSGAVTRQHPSETASFAPGLAKGHREGAAGGEEPLPNAVGVTSAMWQNQLRKAAPEGPWLCPLWWFTTKSRLTARIINPSHTSATH